MSLAALYPVPGEPPMTSLRLAAFHDRADAARQLAAALGDRPLCDPLVLAVPRGGVAVGAVLAAELKADLDVVLARKLRHPAFREVAIGAVAEDGRVLLDPDYYDAAGGPCAGVAEEVRHQMAEIDRVRCLTRGVRPKAPIAGRSVIVVDDGIATGSTLLAALRAVRAQRPHELITAIPVAAPDRLAEVRRWCDEVVCLLTPNDFRAVGHYYDDFSPVEDEDVTRLLRQSLPAASAGR